MLSIIKSEFTFFQVQMKLIWINTIELCHSSFAEAPERLYSIYVILSPGKFILTVKYTVVIVSVENEWIICFPSICIDGRSFKYLSLDYRHKFIPRTILNNTYEYPSISFQKSKYWSFTCCSSSSFSPDSLRSEIRFIELKFSSEFISLLKILWFFYR